jgi:hypothetical protein
VTRSRSVLLALTLLGCDSSPTAVSVGQSVVLAPGQSAVVSGGGPRVRFGGVLQDSRCPSDVVCVQAGEVVAEVTIGDGTDPVSLRPGRSVVWGGYTVQLVSVDPYPTSTTRIEPSQYRATFLVDHDSGG